MAPPHLDLCKNFPSPKISQPTEIKQMRFMNLIIYVATWEFRSRLEVFHAGDKARPLLY